MDRKRHNDIHEDLSRDGEIRRSSDRVFGLMLTTFLLAVALGPLVRHHAPRLWALAPAIILLGVSLLLPSLLGPPNTLWMRIGLLLQKVVNPIVMGVLFYGTLTPFAFIMKLMKKDPLQLKWQPDSKSYWIVRTPRGPASQSMKDQF
ncbi:MAG TPA: SxtJ family membrane protein [Candidatus Binataceae bacterium]|nr:SxtJ family membrane protein [Candidatus Binataceae bacterium]